MPALLTKMSTEPNCSFTAFIISETAASSATSHCIATASPPCSLMRDSVSSAAAALPAYITATFAPSAARATAIARPIPREPPVTTAVLSVKSILSNPLEKFKCFL